ncbi:MAG: MFS transporter [Thermodesulfobacteriota bacterium]
MRMVAGEGEQQAEHRPDGDHGAAVPPGEAGSRPSLWVSSTYFAEGFPYGVVNNLAEILFKELGASLQVVGLTALFHLPWNLKFLWGPLLDQYETKRTWIVATEVALAVGLALLAVLAGASPGLAALSLCFAVLAFLSATHDIAIDGYYLESLRERDQSSYVGFRATAYRLATLVIGGPLLYLIGGALGWTGGLLLASGVMAALTVYHARWLPRAERRRQPLAELLRRLATPRRLGWLAAIAVAVLAAAVLVRTAPLDEATRAELWSAVASFAVTLAGWTAFLLLAALVVALASLDRIRARLERRDSPYASAFVSFLEQPRTALVLAFIISFRVGESFLVKMRWPFLRDTVGMTLDDYAIANGTLGVVAGFAATFVGGKLIARDGLRRWIWPFVLAQNVLNLLYVWLAWLGASASGAVTTAVIALEQFGAGLGTAVFMVYLMRCCDPAHRAAHMAIVTALMSVSFTLAGVASGFLAGWMGFATYFVFTFVVTIPGMALVFFLPHLDGREASPASPTNRLERRPASL